MGLYIGGSTPRSPSNVRVNVAGQNYYASGIWYKPANGGAIQCIWSPFTEKTFNYTGAVQTQVLYPGRYLFEVRGGGSNVSAGGYSSGEYQITSTTTVYIYVGGRGDDSNAGGWNGGGTSNYQRTFDGAGATDIRIGGTALGNRVIVAGGAGGGCYNGGSAKGGGLEGESGQGGSCGTAGGGGTQTGRNSGGNAGSAQNIGGNGSGTYGSGGGGGYWGGNGAAGDGSGWDDKPGGGGSGYIGGVINGTTIQGGGLGASQHGKAKISAVGNVQTESQMYNVRGSTVFSQKTSFGSETDMQGFYISPDGLHLYIGRWNSYKVEQWNLSSPYDVSTATLVTSISAPSVDGICFSPDGTYCFIGQEGNNYVKRYTLSTPWSLATASQDQTLTLSSGYPMNINISSNGLNLYSSTSAGKLEWYQLTSPFNLSGATLAYTYSSGSGNTNMIKQDGKFIYVATNGAVNQYSLATPYNISSARYLVGTQSSIGGADVERSFRVSDDGQYRGISTGQSTGSGIKIYKSKFLSYIPNSSTIVYYPLDTYTTVNDMKGSGTAYNLTNSGNVTFGSYQGVNSAWFNSLGGSTGSCGLYNTTNTTIINATSGQYSFAIWMYKGSETMYYNPRIISTGCGNNVGAPIFTYAGLQKISSGDHTDCGITPPAGWFLFGASADMTNHNINYYLNGELVSTQSSSQWSGVPTSVGNGISFGTRDTLGTGYGDKRSGAMSNVIVETGLWNGDKHRKYYQQTLPIYSGLSTPYAYYPLTVNANDMSGNGRHLSADSSITYNNQSGAVCPNTNHTGLVEPFNITSSGTRTIMWWQKTTAVHSSDGRGIDIYFNGSNRICTLWNNGNQGYYCPTDVSLNCPETAGVWYRHAITINNGQVKLYVNNVLKHTGSLTTGLTSTNFRRGQEYNNAYNRQLYGNLKDIIVYNTVVPEGGLTYYWNLNKGGYGY